MNQILKSLKNPIVQQNGLEFLFPIIGYLFFDWSFLVIALFYLVDQLGNQVNFFARLKFVQKLYLPLRKWLFPAAVIIFLIFFSLELVWIYHIFTNHIYDCQTEFFFTELTTFFYNEFWMFLPLLIVLNYMKDKLTFYKSDLPYMESPEKMMVFNIFPLLGAFALIALVFLVWQIFKPSMLLLIVFIAIFKLLSDALIIPLIKKRYFKKI